MLVAKQNNKRSVHGVSGFNLSQKPWQCYPKSLASTPQPPAPERATALLFVFNFLDFLSSCIAIYICAYKQSFAYSLTLGKRNQTIYAYISFCKKNF